MSFQRSRKSVFLIFFIFICVAAALFISLNSSSLNSSIPLIPNLNSPQLIKSHAIIPWETHLPLSKMINSSLFSFMNVNLSGENGLSAVGIVDLGNNDFLLCSYTEISRLQKNNNTWTLVVIPPPDNVSVWNPAGLFYDRDNATLYIANYQGHDVLVVTFDSSRNLFTLKKRITDEQMVGPENIWVDSGSIWVADYDGNAIFKFNDAGDRLLKVDIPEAHGILVTRDFVYATSLANRSVILLDKNGTVIKKQGELGTAPGDYLWPVDLIETKDGELAVLDSQMGRITLLTPDLTPTSAFGGNGPGLDLMNYPYGFTQTDDGYVLTDTIKSRVIFFSDDWEIKGIVSEDIENVSNIGMPCVYGMNSEPYTYPDFPGINIISLITGIKTNETNKKFYGGFNSIDTINQENTLVNITKQVELDNPQNPGLSGNTYWYMTWAKLFEMSSNQQYLVIGSPQQNKILVVDLESGIFFEYPVHDSIWIINGTFVSNTGAEINLNDTIQKATIDFSKVNNLLESGLSRSEAYREVFHPNISENDFETNFWEPLLSDSQTQKDLWNAYKENLNLSSYAYTSDLESVSNYYVYLKDLLAIRYLSGMQFNSNEIPKDDINDESDANFYSGHELNIAINNDNLYDYAAAIENGSSYNFSLMLKSPEPVNAVILNWQESSIPKRFEVNFFDSNNITIKKETFENNLNESNIILLNSDVPITKISLNFTSFSGQQRLILRSVSIFSPPSEGLFYNNISELTQDVSKSLNYSAQPLVRYNGNLSFVILENGYGNCGQLAYLLYNKIESNGGESRELGLVNNESGAIHVVVLVKDPYSTRWLVADPTLGIFYNATLQELQNKDYWSTHSFKIDPRFDGYYGTEFYNANQSISYILYRRMDIENALWNVMIPSNQTPSLIIFNNSSLVDISSVLSAKKSYSI
jgi:hypothetical protein